MQPKRLSILVLALLTHCGTVVQPGEDGGRADSSVDRDSLEPRADSGADAIVSTDAGPLRQTSMVRVTNEATTVSVVFSPFGQTVPAGQPPEFVGGCRVRDTRGSNIVDAGSVTIRYPAGEHAVEPWAFRNNQYHIVEMLPHATPGDVYTLRATGSAEFPAFSLGCSIPEGMPPLTEPANSAVLEYREDRSITFRWAVLQTDDWVRVNFSAGNTDRQRDLGVECVAPLSQGTLTVPAEAIRMLRDYPNYRNVTASRFRRVNIVVGDAPIEMQCGSRSQWLVNFR